MADEEYMVSILYFGTKSWGHSGRRDINLGLVLQYSFTKGVEVAEVVCHKWADLEEIMGPDSKKSKKSKSDVSFTQNFHVQEPGG
jgi:hypothetical protein